MRVFLTLCWTLVLSVCAVAAEIPGSAFRSGVWNGGAYTSDQTGRFSHCGISTPYKSGDSLFFFVNDDGTYNLAVSKPEAEFTKGQVFPVTFMIDRRAPFYGEGVAQSERFLVLHIFDKGQALEALKRGSVLRILSENRRSGYNLGGTFKAFEATRKCAAYYRNYVGTPVAQAPAPTAPAAAAPAPVDQSVLYQIATDMIAEIGVKDPRYLSREEAKTFTPHEGVFWASPSANLYGGVYYRASGGIRDLRDSDAQDLHEITHTCTGDIVSGARKVPADEFPAREMRALCKLENEFHEAIVTKYLVDDIILYTALLFVDPAGSPAPADREEERRELSQNVTARAASFVAKSR